MRFSREEFDVMVHQLLYSDTVSFDMLCAIAEKTLRPTVIRWCREDDYLRGRGYEEDLMQDILLRLMKTTVDSFLLHERAVGPFNDDPEGFEDWMFRVARNLKNDLAGAVRNIDFHTEELDTAQLTTAPVHDGMENQERIDELKQAVAIVLSADVSVYKVLTWFAQLVFILDQDVTKIQSNDLILAAFENRTLGEMYDTILTASKRIPWLAVTEQQNAGILAALQKTWKDDVTYGEARYRDFFMTSNAEASGKKSISDWVNRMNGIIRRKTGALPGEKKPKQKTPRPAKGKKRGCADEPSDSG